MPITTSQATIDVEFWYNRGSGWVPVQTIRYSAISEEHYYGEKMTFTLDGMGAYTDFGMDYTVIEGTGDAAPSYVEWYETTTPPEYDATPTGASDVPYVAVAGT